MKKLHNTLRIVLKEWPDNRIKDVLKFIFRFFPTNPQKIVFSNFNGKGYGDNPKYICSEILRQGLPYELVWLTSDIRNMPNKLKVIPFNSYRAVYECSTAKVIINNVKNGLPYIKRNTQYTIQTWHATVALKYVEGESEELLGNSYVSKSKKDSQMTDLILTSNLFDYNVIRSSFWYDGEIFNKGLPRNDIFLNSTDEEKCRIKRNLGLPQESNLIMYAPTFRDDHDLSCYDLDYENLLDAFEKKTGQKWILLLRMHPTLCASNLIFSNSNLVIDVSSYSDPQELVLISDFLITDYSSISIDATINKTPVILYASDLERYKHGRGLRPLYFDLPFVFTQTNEELISAVLNFDGNLYWKKVNEFMSAKIVSYDDGHASERVVDRIKQVIDGEG